VLVAAACLGGKTIAQDEREDTAEKTLSPYFFVKGDPKVDQLPLKSTDVQASIAGVIADVTVKQTYANEGTRPINATYVFPASTRAAVYAMRMRIGDEIVYAKIKEREQAKKDFEKAKQEGKSASLLEEHRPNVFSMSLANVMPGDTIEIELRYTELLVPTDGVYEFMYPTVVGPRYRSPEAEGKGDGDGDKWVGMPYLRSGQKPTSTLHISTRIAAGLPISELRSVSHEVTPEWDATGTGRLTLDKENAFDGNRDFVIRYRLTGNKMASGLLLFQGEDENFFLYMAQPPNRVADAEIPPREYVFVVDVSGSMEGFPIATAKHLVNDLIGKLRPTDYFNVVLFAGDSTILSPTSLQANDENIARAITLLTKQRGAGGTDLLPAIKQAMSVPQHDGVARSVVLVTDGYVSGEEGVFEYIRKNLGEANMFAFGIGESVNRYLIEGIAKAGGGEPFIVTSEKEAEETADRFREYIQTPVLTNINIKAQGFEAYDVEPGHFADMMAMRPIILYGKWRGSPTGTIELTGMTGNGPYSDSFDVSSVQPDPANSALRYLWARSRIAELSDYGSPGVSDDKIKQITDLGLKYNLLTRYTSFIAIREKIVNPDGTAKDVNQPLPMPIGVSDLAVGDEPELVWLMIAVGMVAAVWVLKKRFSMGIRTPQF